MTPNDSSLSLQRCAGMGALSACIGVGLGAFGAHGLKSILTPDMLAVFETGVRYHMYQAGGMITAGLAGLVWRESPRRFLQAAWSFGLGTIAFSGSLYALALSGMQWLGAITPVGGILTMAGWLLLASALLGRK